MAVGLLLTACAAPGESRIPSSEASRTVEATASAQPTDALEPTPSPTPEILEPSAYGSRATVTADHLRVRFAPSLDAEIRDRLNAGTEVRLMEGPVVRDGFRWYSVSYGGDIEMRYPRSQAGWVAESPITASGEPDGDPFIEVAPPICPASVDAAMLAGLSLFAIGVCDVQVGALHGLVDYFNEAPISPFAYEPGWVYFSREFLRKPSDHELVGWFYSQVAFPPGVDAPERGDIVTLHGQIGFDESHYGRCAVHTTAGYDLPVALDFQGQLWDQQCQLRFVVSEVTVEDHVDLPPI